MVATSTGRPIGPPIFLGINKQSEQPGEVPHGLEFVVKPDLDGPGPSRPCSWAISETVTFCSAVTNFKEHENSTW